MEKEGSRRNPFSMNQFNSLVNSGHWQGGWVTHDEGLVYHSQYLSTCTCDGSLSNPIPNSFYNEMLEREIWLGGWVSVGIVKYFDSNGIQYDANIGDENNPCPINVYNEIVLNGFWVGGWIQESDGTKRYIQNFPLILNLGGGCGCGSSGGCGCGSGSGGNSGGCDGGCDGCGSDGGGYAASAPNGPAGGYAISEGNCTPGIVQINTNGIYHTVGELQISWTAGNTMGSHELSVVSVSINFSDSDYQLLENNIQASWSDVYEVQITGSLTIQANQTTLMYDIDGDFLIPPEYRQWVYN